MEPESRYPVCIIGIGARTPVGLTAPAAAAAVRASISGIGDHPYMIDKAGAKMSVAMDPELPPELNGLDRLLELAKSALEEAIVPLSLMKSQDLPSIPIIVGLPHLRPGLEQNFETQFADRLSHQNHDSSTPRFYPIQPILGGHSAGIMALEEGWRQIQAGQTEFCLIGGVDSYMHPDTLEWLDQEEQLMSAENRSGFPPGEGAGFCLLASSKRAKKLQCEILGWVVGAATAYEQNRIKTETICIGEGLTKAIETVLAFLKLPEEKINWTICDLNGERYRSEELTFTLLRTQGGFVSHHDYETPANCWGDLGAASGPLFVDMAIASGQRGYAKGPRTLLWTSAEGGQRCAAILYVQGYSGRDAQ
jgi:3-oxoacyl-[acyl-carrier-protein] synthase-1